MKGYDIDGVITIGIKPESDAIIITGRSYEEAPETIEMLRSKGIFNAVYFNPETFDEKTPKQSGQWKGRMIEIAGIEDFWEDSDIQAKEIKLIVNNCNVHMVRSDGENHWIED